MSDGAGKAGAIPRPLVRRLATLRERPLAAVAGIAVTALAAFGAVTLADGGGGSSTPLPALARDQQAYLGDRVTTGGVVRRLTDPDGSHYYVLSDGRGDVVLLRPQRAVGRYRGRRVRVSGDFRFDPNSGRFIAVRRIGAAR